LAFQFKPEITPLLILHQLSYGTPPIPGMGLTVGANGASCQDLPHMALYHL
jgi:hypothetical protein